MATAVLDLELQQLPPEITGLDRYSKALVLIRLRRRPVGQVTLPVIGGRIAGTELHDALIDAADWPLVAQYWLRDYLDLDQQRAQWFVRPKATVAVCTRDRPEDLRRCLRALMQLPDDGQEILIIDNAPSTEATRVVVEQCPSIRYVREPRPGLNVARNRALREAQHEVVAFIDDDAAPDAGWLRALVQNFDDPLVYCVTGLTMPLELDAEAQEWHESYSTFVRGFRRRVFDGTSFNPTAGGQAGSGVNMALRRSVSEKLGPFDEALDAGTRTRSGGDAEMFSRILSAGYRIVYDPQALNWHRHRRTWGELRRMAYGYGVGVYAAWTRSFLVEHETVMLQPALAWFTRRQLPTLIRSVLQPSGITFDLILSELRGCAAGPWAYLASRRAVRKGRR